MPTLPAGPIVANIFSDILRPVTGPVLTAGVSAPAKGVRVLPVATGARVGFIGDSIMQFNHANGSPTTGVESLTTSSRGELVQALMSDPRFHMEVWHDTTVNTPPDANARYFKGANNGWAGEASDTAQARFAADVLARNPDVTVIAIGTNNLTASNTVAADVLDMADQAIAAGKTPVVCTVRPWAASVTTKDSQIPYFQATNAAIRAGVAARPKAILCDLAAAYGTPDAFSHAPADYFADGLHPAPKGAALGGAAMSAALALAIQPGNWLRDLLNSGANLLPSSIANMSGGTAGVKGGTATQTGSLATGFTSVSNTASGAAFSLEDNAETGGKSQVITITPGGTGTNDTFTPRVATNVTTGAGSFATGDYLIGIAEVEHDDWPSWAGARLVVSQTGGTANAGTGSAGISGYPRQPVAGRQWLLTPPLLLVSGVTSAGFSFGIPVIANGATGTGTMKIHRMGLFKVADPRIAWNG